MTFYARFIEAVLCQIRRNANADKKKFERDPRIQSPLVKENMDMAWPRIKRLLDREALAKQAKIDLEKRGNVDPKKQEIHEETSRLFYKILADELWPIMEELYQKSEHAALAQEYWNKQAQDEKIQDLIEQLKESGKLKSGGTPTSSTPDPRGPSLHEFMEAMCEKER